MNRRHLLVCLGVSITGLSGCFGSNTNAPHTIYVDNVNSEDIDPETDEVCEFENLSDDVKAEVERAIEENGYSTDSHPIVLDSNCYHSYIHYDGEYYKVVVGTV